MSDKPICAECKHLIRPSGCVPLAHPASWMCTPTKDIDYITGGSVRKYCESLNLSGECTLFGPLDPDEREEQCRSYDH